MILSVICNNYNRNYDGIGAFASVMVNNYPAEVSCNVYSAECLQEASKFQKIFCGGMTAQIRKLKKKIQNGNFDKNEQNVVILEYPFVEWNPMVVIEYKKLHERLQKERIPLFLSLHEYERVNILRKKVIESLASNSDYMFVTTREMGEALTSFCSNYQLRNIPSAIYPEGTAMIEPNTKDRDLFVYFGLINKAKAFDEMLEGWQLFHKENPLTRLVIMSGTKTENNFDETSGIEYIYDATAEQVSDIMQMAAYALVPVKPAIDDKNTTFKTATLMGCLTIGRFVEEYAEKSFSVNMDEYSGNSFYDALAKAYQMPQEAFGMASVAGQKLAQDFKPQVIAKNIVEYIKSVIDSL